MNRAAHLRYCAFVSVRKRLYWIVPLALLLGVIAFVLGGGMELALVTFGLALVISVLAVALDSVRRHSGDPEAQTFLGS
ncbi:hypothetical protein [Deinococcus planocerae]|uniref:hypothetical protein n=1 Tax=Deinococcus planocerae TaxID=1737569 RepID=UPI000C7EDDA1|nr:hypothetical protein [Deinococcus planocerae]